MIDSQKNHGYGKNQQDNHPSPFVGSQQSGICIQFDKIPSQVYQTTRCQNLCYVIKGSLPANKLCLVFIGQFTHIHSVASDVVSSSAKSNNGQQRNGNTEKMGQVQRKSYQPESNSCNQLSNNHKKFLCPEKFKKRTPQWLQCPGQKNQRRPEGD